MFTFVSLRLLWHSSYIILFPFHSFFFFSFAHSICFIHLFILFNRSRAQDALDVHVHVISAFSSHIAASSMYINQESIMTLTSIQLIRLKPDVVQPQPAAAPLLLVTSFCDNIVHKIRNEAKTTTTKNWTEKWIVTIAICLPFFFNMVHFLCPASFTPQLYGIRNT